MDIEKQQWSISMVNMVELSLEPLYEISGEYGTKSQGSNLGAEDAAKWSSECVYNDALFPWVEGLDLCQIHWGPVWRTPTEARIITPEPGAKYFLRPIDTRK